MKGDEAEIGLTEAISALRDELIATQIDGDAKSLANPSAIRFEVGTVTIVLQTAVTKNANGSLGWKVIQLGGSLQSEATQTVTITLTPRQANLDGSLANPLIADHLNEPAGASNRAPSRVRPNQARSGGDAPGDGEAHARQPAIPFIEGEDE